MSNFLSLAERPLEYVGKEIEENLKPLTKLEQRQFKKWLRVTKQQVDSRDSQFAKLIADRQIAWQRHRLLNQKSLRNSMLKNRTFRRKLIKAGIVQKNMLPSKYFGRSVRKLRRFSYVGGTHFFLKSGTKKYFFRKKKPIKNYTKKKNKKTT